MSLFGSPEDDPLLQGDPFAPSSSGSEASDDADSVDERRGASTPGRTQSVFEDGETYRVVRSAREAEDGELEAVNAVLREGGVLDHVELHGTSASEVRTVVFVLRRPDDEV